jgi:hypothetical protein
MYFFNCQFICDSWNAAGLNAVVQQRLHSSEWRLIVELLSFSM